MARKIDANTVEHPVSAAGRHQLGELIQARLIAGDPKAVGAMKALEEALDVAKFAGVLDPTTESILDEGQAPEDFTNIDVLDEHSALVAHLSYDPATGWTIEYPSHALRALGKVVALFSASAKGEPCPNCGQVHSQSGLAGALISSILSPQNIIDQIINDLSRKPAH